LEINVEHNSVRNSKQPSHNADYDRPRQLKNVEYFSYLVSMITNYSKCTPEIKYRIAKEKSAFKKKTFSSANWT
jgi:hypothetical protein